MYHDKKVLLIDADPQSSLTASLLKGQNPDQLEMTLTTVMDATIEDRPIDEFSGILHHDEGVDLLPSNIELSGMETGLFNIMSREYVLRNYIDSVRKNYDYILIDCMPSLGMMTINALVAADSVIIPSQPSFLSTKGLNLLLHSINKIKRGINPSLKIDGILFTMVNNRTNNAKDIIGAMRDTVGQNIRVWGQLHLRYLKEHRRVRYANLLTSGKLNGYLVDIDRQAEEMFERLVKQMAEREGVTEQLKAASSMEWVRKLNSIRNRAVEITNSELIYA